MKDIGNNIIIREIRQEDKQGLYRLFDDVWPEETLFQHKKIDWIVESEWPGLCAEEDGKIIGSRTCIPANLYYGKEKMTAVQFLGSCVDANYRRYGLFTRMNRAFLVAYFRSNNEVIFNVSVDASRKAYEKSGWVYIDAMSNMIKICRPFDFISKTKGNINVLSGVVSVDESDIPDISYICDELFKSRETRLESENCLHIKYDKDTLQWRLRSDSNIKLLKISNLGVCFYKTGYKKGLRWCTIGEIFLNDYSSYSFRKMLSILKTTDNFDVINTYITQAHPLYKLYRRNGFMCNPMKRFLNLGIKVQSEVNKEICLNPSNWALSFLDIDTF